MNSLPVFIILAIAAVLLIIFGALEVSQRETEKEPDTPETHEFDRDGLHFAWSPYSVFVRDKDGNTVFRTYTNQFKTDDEVYDAYKELSRACRNPENSEERKDN